MRFLRLSQIHSFRTRMFSIVKSSFFFFLKGQLGSSQNIAIFSAVLFEHVVYQNLPPKGFINTLSDDSCFKTYAHFLIDRGVTRSFASEVLAKLSPEMLRVLHSATYLRFFWYASRWEVFKIELS